MDRFEVGEIVHAGSMVDLYKIINAYIDNNRYDVCQMDRGGNAPGDGHILSTVTGVSGDSLTKLDKLSADEMKKGVPIYDGTNEFFGIIQKDFEISEEKVSVIYYNTEKSEYMSFSCDIRNIYLNPFSFCVNHISFRVNESTISDSIIDGSVTRRRSLIGSSMQCYDVRLSGRHSRIRRSNKDTYCSVYLASTLDERYTEFVIGDLSVIMPKISKKVQDATCGNIIKCVNDKKTTKLVKGRYYEVIEVICNMNNSSLDMYKVRDLENGSITKNYKHRFNYEFKNKSEYDEFKKKKNISNN